MIKQESALPLVPMVPFDTFGTYSENKNNAKNKKKAKREKRQKPGREHLTSKVLDALYEQGIGSSEVLPSGEKTRKRDLKLESRTANVI